MWVSIAVIFSDQRAREPTLDSGLRRVNRQASFKIEHQGLRSRDDFRLVPAVRWTLAEVRVIHWIFDAILGIVLAADRKLISGNCLVDVPSRHTPGKDQ